MDRRDDESFRILPFFTVISLLCFIVTAVLVVTLNRQVNIDSIVTLGERSNVILAQAAMNPMRLELVDYLRAVQDMDVDDISAHRLEPALLQSIHNVIDDHSVIRIKLYNNKGIVAYSTNPELIGQKRANRGFNQAMGGKIVSELFYRDSGHFEGTTERENLIHSYVPVRLDSTDPILGVFEIYTDVNELVQRREKASLVIAVGSTIILAALFILLFMIVRRAGRIIERQQNTIRERTRTLELLSAQLITAQEDEKKQISITLHEGIAQTLSAVKTHVELLFQEGEKGAAVGALEQLMPVIQGDIRDIRDFAMELRPSSLDDFGIVETLSSWCDEFQASYPSLQIEIEIDAQEREIPDPLKIVIFRIVQETMTRLAKGTLSSRVRLALGLVEKGLSLTISDENTAGESPGAALGQGSSQDVGVAVMRERTVLSGGTFSVLQDPAGWTVRRAFWHG